MSIVTQTPIQVKSWETMSQYERWLVDPYRAGREDAAKARTRYRAVGGQRNYSLLENAKLYMVAAEHFVGKGYLNLAAYYLELVKEHIALLEGHHGLE